MAFPVQIQSVYDVSEQRTYVEVGVKSLVSYQTSFSPIEVKNNTLSMLKNVNVKKVDAITLGPVSYDSGLEPEPVTIHYMTQKPTLRVVSNRKVYAPGYFTAYGSETSHFKRVHVVDELEVENTDT